MRAFLVIYLVGWTVQGFPAPVEDGEGDQEHRDSTKAILTLEQQLKQSAGEDKKFFSKDTAAGQADQQALEELAAAGAAQEPKQAYLEELASMMDGPLVDEAEEPVDLPDFAQDEPTASEDEPEVDTSSDNDQPEVDENSPYRVYAVSEKRVSQPEVPQELPEEIPELEEYPTEEEEENEFAENLLDFLQRYPQIVELMDETKTQAEYQEMLRLQNQEDREEAIKAEILASQQKDGGSPMEDQLAYGPEYSHDYPMSGDEARYRHPEVEQQYNGNTIGRTVAKKRGYETPPEYLEWLRSLSPEEQQEALNIEERAADHDNTEEALQQNSYVPIAM